MSRLEELLLTWHEGDLDAERTEELKAALAHREGRAELFEHFFMTAAVADAFRSQKGIVEKSAPKKRLIPLRAWAAAACLIAAVGLMVFRSGRGTVERLPAIPLEGPGVGVVLSDVSGVVIHRAGQEIPCGENTSIYERDRIETSAASRVLMYFRDGTSRIFLREDTSVEIAGVTERKDLRLERGTLSVMVLPGVEARMTIASRHADIAVTGTRFEIRATEDETSVKMHRGRVRVRTSGSTSWTEVLAGRTAAMSEEKGLSVGSLPPAAEAGALVREFDMPAEMKQPGSSAHDGLVLWVCDRLSNVLYKLDDTDGRMLGKLAIPDTGRWPNLIGWDGRSLWVQNWDREVYEVSPATGAIRRKLLLPMDAGEWELYGASVEGGSLRVIGSPDGQRRQKMWTISLATGRVVDTREYSAKPHYFRFTYLDEALWVRRTTVIYKVDPETGTVLKQFGGPLIHHGAVDSDGIGSLWNVTGSTRKAYLIDTGERPWKE